MPAGERPPESRVLSPSHPNLGGSAHAYFAVATALRPAPSSSRVARLLAVLVFTVTTVVAPVAAQDPSYPRAFENTLLTFLVFSGIYLLISLTASILREQVAN